MTTCQFSPSQASSPLWRLLAPSLPSPPSPCPVPQCSSPAPLTCGGCQAVSYCSKEHQRSHWPTHRAHCAPFKLVTSATKGRHLVATRALAPGDTVLQELPVTAGPQQYTAPVCLGCHTPASLTGPRCSGCSWPVCGPECEARPIHRAECKVFSHAGLKPTQLRRKNGGEMEDGLGEEHPMYECVTPLRVCLARLERRENWGVVEALATHREQRQFDENSLHNKHNIVNFLLKNGKLEDSLPGVTEAEITRAVDVLDVNAFEMPGRGCGPLRGLYPFTAMMNASCSPNTQNSIDGSWLCTVRAVRAIAKGEEITDTYTSTMANTLYRRRQLKAQKYFDCTCARCSDPTELGSHFSTLLCRATGCTGFVLCGDPLDNTSAWSCLKCGLQVEGEEVRREQEEWEEKLEAAPRELAVQEALLAELKQLYHPGHNLCCDVLFNLVPLYGSSRGRQERPEAIDLVAEAERKEAACTLLLDTMALVVPGQFRVRGMLLVELHTTRAFLLRSQLESGRSSKSQFVRRLAGLRPQLLEALEVLGREPEGSLEASRREQAQGYLTQLEGVVANAGKTLLPADKE